MRVLLLFCAFVISQNGFSQTGIVQLNNMNVLYVGVSTPITFGVSGKKVKTTALRVSDNIEIVQSDPQTVIKATEKGKGFIQVGFVKRDTTWLDSTIYRIKSLPKPEARFGTINSGKTIPKPALLVHRRITAGMGSGFVASNVFYNVISYRLTLIDYNDMKKFNVVGNYMTDSILRAIRLSKGGVLLIDKIHASANFTEDVRVLSPIHLKIRTSKYDLLYADFKVVTKSNSLLNVQNVRKTENLIDLTDSIETGKVTLYYPDKHIENTFKKGVINQQTFYDQSGLKSLEIRQKDSIVQEVTSYYPSGQVKVKTHINDTLFYLGDSTYIKYFNYNSLPFANQNYTDSFGCPNHFVINHGFTPIGEYIEFYENGNLKCKGNIVLVQGLKPTLQYKDSVERYGLKSSFINSDRAMLQGNWYYYNPDGSVNHIREYEEGIIKSKR